MKMHKDFHELTENDYSGLLTELEAVSKERAAVSRQLKVANNMLSSLQATTAAQTHFNRQLSEQKSLQNRYTQLLLDNWMDIVLVFDVDLNFVLGTNHTMAGININVNRVYGTSFRKIFEGVAEPEWIDNTEKKLQQAHLSAHTESYSEQIRFLALGGPRYYEASIIAFKNDTEQSMGVMFLLHDTTELITSKNAAEYANQVKSDFLANMSHEIRTPMNAIIGIADILKSSCMDEKQMMYVTNISKAAVSLLSIINDILDFSKIEANRMDISSSVFDLVSFIENIVVMTTELASAKGLLFTCSISDDTPCFIESDDIRLRQVLNNLLSNAIKYSVNGEIKLAISTKGGRLCLDVSDSGIGIREEDIDKLFRPFEQLDLVKNKSTVGTGLGLAITKRIVELMSGEIAVSSEYGVGSTFSVSFPLIAADGEPIDSFDKEIAFRAPTARVLVADDVDVNLIIAEALLQEHGINPVLAANGVEALEKVQQEDFDLILMDQMMPEMDGVEATSLIRKLGGRCAEIPIIALTANAVSGVKEQLIENGFSDFLSKPIDRMLFDLTVCKWLPKDKIE